MESGRAAELLLPLGLREVLPAVRVIVGGDVSSGSPNQTGEQIRDWLEVKLTSKAYHGGLVVRLVNGRLCVQCQHEYVDRW